MFTKLKRWFNGSQQRRDPVQLEKVNELEYQLRWAETAWDLPATYYTDLLREDCPQQHGLPDVYRSCAMNEIGNGQSPHHRIMSGCHPHLADLHQQLWDNERYIRVLQHVFHRVEPEDALAVAQKLDGHGYWQPMVAVIKEAAARGLIGNERIFDGLKRQYGPRGAELASTSS